MEPVYIVGSVVWFSIMLANKSGPFNLISKFREWTFTKFGESNSPLSCAFCTSFWVLFPILLLSEVAPYIVQFFGILGFAAALRGMSNEY